MIVAAIKTSIAVLGDRMDKADEQIRELKMGTKLLFQGVQGQSKI